MESLVTSADAVGALPSTQLIVFRLLAAGKTVAECAHQLGVSAKSVDSRKYRIMRRLEVHDRLDLARLAVEAGIMDSSTLARPHEPFPDVLSLRQRQVIVLIGKGIRTREIAEILGISVKSVEGYKYRGMKLLELADRIAVFHYCVRWGLISIDVEVRR